MKKLLFISCYLLSFILASAQSNVYINPAANLLNNAPATVVDLYSGTFQNDGSYIDNAGIVNVNGGVTFSGTGTTTLYNLYINNTGTTTFNSLVSVYGTATLASGTLVANNNLFIRSDVSTMANLVVAGILAGNVQGVIPWATIITAPCPSFLTDLSLNISGPVMKYQWQISPDSVAWADISGATAATYTANVTATAWYRCALSTTNSSFNQSTPGIKTTLTGVPAPVVASGTGTYCGSAIIAASGGAGGIMYFEGTIPNGTSTLMPASTDTVTTSGTYYFRSQSVTGCWSSDDSVAVIVNPLLYPAINVSTATGDSVCAGIATFNTLAVNTGSAPTYAWAINGTIVTGATSNTYTYDPVNGDSVTAVLNSNATCATPAIVSGSMIINVIPNQIPHATITAVQGDVLCFGSVITFTTAATYGGNAPVYRWMRNNVFTFTGAAYSFIPTNGDHIYAEIHSNYRCLLTDSSATDTVTVEVDTPYIPAVHVDASPGTHIMHGESVMLTATETGGGPSPAYQWLLNGAPIAGATNVTYTSSTFNNHDSVTCIVTGSGQCRLSSFNSIEVIVVPAGITQVSGGANVILVPNPNKGTFTIKGTLQFKGDENVLLEVTDMLGHVVYKNKVNAGNGQINETITLGNILVSGMYICDVISDSDNIVFHFLIEK